MWDGSEWDRLVDDNGRLTPDATARDMLAQLGFVETESDGWVSDLPCRLVLKPNRRTRTWALDVQLMNGGRVKGQLSQVGFIAETGTENVIAFTRSRPRAETWRPHDDEDYKEPR